MYLRTHKSEIHAPWNKVKLVGLPPSNYRSLGWLQLSLTTKNALSRYSA